MSEAFRHLLRTGLIIVVPHVVHIRDARDETMGYIRAHRSTEITGVLHCVTKSFEMRGTRIGLWIYISMSGIVSLPKPTKVHEVCRKIP
jgi:Mg-dependent DNase